MLHVFDETITARIDEWYQLLSTYHDGVLSWVGGSEKVEGTASVRCRGTGQAVPDQVQPGQAVPGSGLLPVRVELPHLPPPVTGAATMRDVYVAGIGMTRFTKQPECGLKELTAEAVTPTLKDAGKTADEVQACYFGNAVAGSMTGQEMLAGQFSCGRSAWAGSPSSTWRTPAHRHPPPSTSPGRVSRPASTTSSWRWRPRR